MDVTIAHFLKFLNSKIKETHFKFKNVLRFQGASILVVQGERNLRTCGMLDHNKNKAPTSVFMPHANEQVKVTLDTHAQEIDSKEQEMHAETLHPGDLPKADQKSSKLIEATMRTLDFISTTEHYEESLLVVKKRTKKNHQTSINRSTFNTRHMRHVKKKFTYMEQRIRRMRGNKSKISTTSREGEDERRHRVEKLASELDTLSEDAAREEGVEKTGFYVFNIQLNTLELHSKS